MPLLVRLDLVFGWKASAFPRQANGQDKGCESEGTKERPGLEQTVAREDPPRSTTDGHDDAAASVLSLSSWGGG